MSTTTTRNPRLPLHVENGGRCPTNEETAELTAPLWKALDPAETLQLALGRMIDRQEDAIAIDADGLANLLLIADDLESVAGDLATYARRIKSAAFELYREQRHEAERPSS